MVGISVVDHQTRGERGTVRKVCNYPGDSLGRDTVNRSCPICVGGRAQLMLYQETDGIMVQGLPLIGTLLGLGKSVTVNKCHSIKSF